MDFDIIYEGYYENIWLYLPIQSNFFVLILKDSIKIEKIVCVPDESFDLLYK